MLSALDTLSLPVFTQVMPGERSDDPLYLPAIVQVQKTLGCRGLLHVGDYKLAALATWVFVQSTQDSCLCPLVEIQLPPAELKTYLALIWIGERGLTTVYRQKEDGQRELVAEGYERAAPLTAMVEGETIIWVERCPVICSLKHA